MRHLRLLIFFLACFLASPVLAKESLTIGLTQFPSSLHPGIDAMAAKNYVLDFTRRPFTTYDASWKLTCMLCTELPTRENGRVKDVTREDGTKALDVTYTIQPGAVWGDGTPITSQDVIFSYEVGRHEKSGYAAAQLFQRDIESITAVDDKNFTVHLRRASCKFQHIDDLALVPAHLEREIFNEDPAAYRNRSNYETKPTLAALYYGPYLIAEVAKGSHIVLTRNPRWWGKKPAFDRITVRVIENTAALEANLLAGQIDMIAGEVGALSIEQALAFEKKHGDRYRVIYKPSLVYEHIDLNFADPRFADLNIRRALLLAIDREQIVQKLSAGKNKTAKQSINPLDGVYTDDVTDYPYDPDKARGLLDAAGWKEGPDGIRAKDGKRLSFAFSTTAGNRGRELVQQIIQAQWRAIGVEARIKNEPPRILFGQSLTKGQFESSLFAWMSSPESIPRDVLHADMIPRAENNWSGQNFARYKNAAMDRLLEDLDHQCEPDRQKKLWSDMQRLYADDLPALPLYFRADTYVVPKQLEGYVPTGHQYPTSLWVEDWRWIER